LYQRKEIPVRKKAAKMAISPAIMPIKAPVPRTRLKKNASTNTPSSDP